MKIHLPPMEINYIYTTNKHILIPCIERVTNKHILLQREYIIYIKLTNANVPISDQGV